MIVGIIGAGAWGTALSFAVARGGAEVCLWSFDGQMNKPESVTEIPENIRLTKDLANLVKTDLWLVVTPAAFFRETLLKARPFYNGQPVIICTKGAEPKTGDFMSDVLKSVLEECVDFGVLSGPQFATEVAKGVPTGSSLAGTKNACEAGKKALNQLYIQVSDDVIGTEICGVGKNAVALICGYNSVVAKGENERALVFTRAWNEIVDLGLACGAKLNTFLGLCGIGDLFLTATSMTSRNFSGGAQIASGKMPDGTVEGIYALRGIIERAEKLGVKVPVLREMQEKMKI